MVTLDNIVQYPVSQGPTKCAISINLHREGSFEWVKRRGILYGMNNDQGNCQITGLAMGHTARESARSLITAKGKIYNKIK